MKLLKCPFWVSIISTLLLFFGCSNPTPQSRQPLLLGTNVWPGYEPFYLARAIDQYPENQVKLVEYSSATQVIQAFRNGAIQAAALTLDEVLLLHENDIDARVILVCDVSEGGDAILARAPASNLADLKDKKIAVENTALGAYVLARALELETLQPSDIQVVPLEVDEHEHAFKTGHVDAVVTFEPVKSKLLKEGAVTVFDSSKIPGEIVDVLVVREKDLADFENQIDTLITGWYAALAHLKNNPEDAHKKMASRLAIPAEEVGASFDGLRLPDAQATLNMLSGTPSSLGKSARKLETTMRTQKLLTNSIDISTLTHPQAVAKQVKKSSN